MEEVLGIVAPVPKGDWNNITAYEQLNIVRHNNTLYMAKQDVPASIEPTVSPNWTDYWMLLISPLSATDIVEQVYPVGSLYISANSTDPALIYGGTWEQIVDCFILAASDVSAENPAYVGGDTGGSADAVVVSHTHSALTMSNVAYIDSTSSEDGSTAIGHVQNSTDGSKIRGWRINTYVYESGVDGTGKNMPPYKVFYVWQRIA